MKACIHIYTGDGKGKTSAAMGLALRMAGHGKRVLLAQFLKDGSSGELAALKNREISLIFLHRGDDDLARHLQKLPLKAAK